MTQAAADAPASHPALISDATIGLATMETDPAKWAKTLVSQLSAAEVDVLAGWVSRFRQKYPVVGFLNDGAAPTTVAEARAKKLTD